MALLSAIGVFVLVLVLWQAWKEVSYRRRIPKGVRRLPGPKGLPFIGRVHDIPAMSWLKFYEWNKEYGPIYQTEMFGDAHVWISSEKIAHELLSKRAAIYSDRPVIPNLPDNRTSGNYLALQGRTDTWKRQRRLAAQLMATSASAGLHAYPARERDRFLAQMARAPEQYREFVEQYTSRTVSRLSWGSPHPSAVLRETTFGLLQSISPAGALPNAVTWLALLPRFLSPWQQREKARHDREARLLRASVNYVRDGLADGTAGPSFVRTYLASLIGGEEGAKKGVKEGGGGGGDGEETAEAKVTKWGTEAEATYVVGQMAIAGALTIGSPLQSFILAMLHYPQWQARLQEEIDRVCGDQGRPPQWEDREKMPLLRAVVKEIIRWRPPVPTGIPHALEEDDVWEGYFIPAGATIHALEWGMTRDEERYPDAEAFNPGRWLDPTYPTYREPLTVYPNLAGYSQFGFGRRTCQGVPIVDQDLFLAMGGLAWAFDLRKKRRAGVGGGEGAEIPVHWNEYSPLLIAKPLPFEFDAVIRDDAKRKALDKMWEDEVEEGPQATIAPQKEDAKGASKRRGYKDGDGKSGSKGGRNSGATSDHDDIGSDRGSDTSIPGTDAGGVSSSGQSVKSVGDLRSESDNEG